MVCGSGVSITSDPGLILTSYLHVLICDYEGAFNPLTIKDLSDCISCEFTGLFEDYVGVSSDCHVFSSFLAALWGYGVKRSIAGFVGGLVEVLGWYVLVLLCM